MIELQQPAPDFQLRDQNNDRYSLADFKGHYTLVYFYPKDDTPGCTKEACMIRDVYDEFEQRDVYVVGISHDTPESHAAFAEKYELPFILLSDPDKATIQAYGAFGGVMTKRMSYLLDPEGTVIKKYPKVDPATHAQEILDDLDEIV